MPNTLIHPGTAFAQALSYSEIAYKDMTPLQQRALFDFMYCAGDGSWGQYEDIEAAIKHVGDVKFGVGSFPNDDAMKIAFAMSTDGADYERPLEWFFENCYDAAIMSQAQEPPVIMNNPDVVPECGLFEWGFEWFYSYWVHQPRTDFIQFLPGWNAYDESGRGGQ